MVAGAAARGLEILTVNSNLIVLLSPQQDGTKVGNVVTGPGTTSGLLSSGCSQQDFLAKPSWNILHIFNLFVYDQTRSP